MSDKQKKTLQYVIFVILGVVMLYYALHDINTQELMIQLRKTRLSYVFWITCMGLLSFYFRAARWKLMLDTFGRKVNVTNVTLSIAIGYFVNLVTPRLGEIARCGIVTQYEKISLEKVAGTMVLERLVDLVSLIVLLIFALLFNFDEFMLMFGDDVSKYDSTFFIKLSATVIVAVVVGVVLWRWLISWLQNQDSKLSKRVFEILENIKSGVFSIVRMQNRSMFLVYTVLLWGAYLMMVYFGFKAVPGLEWLGLDAALLVLIFGSVGMIITPGGIGAYQLIVQNTLVKIYGIYETQASSFALLSWALQTLVIILSGAVSWFLLPFLNRKKTDDLT